MSLLESIVPIISQKMVDELSEYADKMDERLLKDAQLLYDNATSPLYPASMSHESRQYREMAWTPVAFTAMIVDKIASMLYSREITRTTGNESLDAVFNEGPWRQMKRFMLRVSKVASIQGFAVIRLRPHYPSGVAYAEMGISNAWPILDPDDPHGPPVGMFYDYIDEPLDAQISRGLGGSSKTVHVKEVITRHMRDKNGDIIAPGVHGRLENGKLVDTGDDGFNPLGDFLDCVMWRGADHPTDGRGRSDILPVINTFRALNESLTDAHELMLWNLWPPWVTDDQNADIRYTPRTLVKLGDNVAGAAAKLERLEWSGNEVGAWKDFYTEIVNAIHETTRVPAIATGANWEHIGNASSGRAFEIMMTPLLELTREKEAIAADQEIELMETTAAMLAYYGKVSGLTERNPFTPVDSPDAEKIRQAMVDATVEFSPVKLPRDQMAEAQVRSILRGAGVESVEQAIRALHPEWDEEEIRKELERVGAGEPETVDASADIRIQQAQERMNDEE